MRSEKSRRARGTLSSESALAFCVFASTSSSYSLCSLKENTGKAVYNDDE